MHIFLVKCELNEIDIDKVEVGQVIRGSKINNIKFRVKDLELNNKYPDVIVKKYTEILDSDELEYKNHEFQPSVNFPIVINRILPDIRTHIGSPEKFFILVLV